MTMYELLGGLKTVLSSKPGTTSRLQFSRCSQIHTHARQERANSSGSKVGRRPRPVQPHIAIQHSLLHVQCTHTYTQYIHTRRVTCVYARERAAVLILSFGRCLMIALCLCFRAHRSQASSSNSQYPSPAIESKRNSISSRHSTTGEFPSAAAALFIYLYIAFRVPPLLFLSWSFSFFFFPSARELALRNPGDVNEFAGVVC